MRSANDGVNLEKCEGILTSGGFCQCDGINPATVTSVLRALGQRCWYRQRMRRRYVSQRSIFTHIISAAIIASSTSRPKGEHQGAKRDFVKPDIKQMHRQKVAANTKGLKWQRLANSHPQVNKSDQQTTNGFCQCGTKASTECFTASGWLAACPSSTPSGSSWLNDGDITGSEVFAQLNDIATVSDRDTDGEGAFTAIAYLVAGGSIVPRWTVAISPSRKLRFPERMAYRLPLVRCIGAPPGRT